MYSDNDLSFTFEHVSPSQQTTLIATISNCKSVVHLSQHVGRTGNMATIKITGLSLDLIAALTSKWSSVYQPNHDGANHVTISYHQGILFKGAICHVSTDLNHSPEHYLEFTAITHLARKLKPVKPFSYQGKISVKQALSTIASGIDYAVDFYQVDEALTLLNPHYTGDGVEQVQTMCQDINLSVNINYDHIEVYHQKIDDVIVDIAPEKGLLGLPILQENGVTLNLVFNNQLRLGRLFNLTTSLPSASGLYIINAIESTISSWLAHNITKTQLIGTRYDQQ